MTLFVEQPLTKAVGLLIIMYNPSVPFTVKQYQMENFVQWPMPKNNDILLFLL